MDPRDRRVAQIVRDFLQAYELSERIGVELREGRLDFAAVERLVGESEQSALYRLKEECHALFRFDGRRTRTELAADELFDLAVGALFHEGMKFREGYYLTTAYGPRFERMMAEGAASGPLADAFRRVIAAGRRRMIESQAETSELFRETRDQLRALLRQLPGSGAVARSLVQDPPRSEAVFAAPLADLLTDVCGSPEEAYRLALEDLLGNGHYEEAAEIAERAELRAVPECAAARSFGAALARYYDGDVAGAVAGLEQWVAEGARGAASWRERAINVLAAVLAEADGADAALRERSHALLDVLRSKPTA